MGGGAVSDVDRAGLGWAGLGRLGPLHTGRCEVMRSRPGLAAQYVLKGAPLVRYTLWDPDLQCEERVVCSPRGVLGRKNGFVHSAQRNVAATS